MQLSSNAGPSSIRTHNGVGGYEHDQSMGYGGHEQTSPGAGGIDMGMIEGGGMGMNGVSGLNGYGQGRTRDSVDLSPETSMHTTWMDLVSQMSGMQ